MTTTDATPHDAGVNERETANREYYDAFASGYEALRGDNDPGGYHQLLDELESEFVRRYASGKSVLEVGCGTGLVLERIARFARDAQGIDLSPGMLEKARARGLSVVEGSATALPFADESFDVTCSFKVLAHVPAIELALCEMARVTRVGGFILPEFYNAHSWRYLVKRFGPAGAIAVGRDESEVFTRFDRPSDVRRYVPRGCRIVAARGIRIVTPSAGALKVPLVGSALKLLERRLCDSQAHRFGGFWIPALLKESRP